MLVLSDVGGGATEVAGRSAGPSGRSGGLRAGETALAPARHRRSASGSGRACSRRYPFSVRSVRPMPLPTIQCCGPVERSISLSSRLPWEGDVSGSRASSGRCPRAHRTAIRQGRRHEDERPRGRLDRCDLDRIARARPRARHRRAAARPDRRGLRPRVVRKDDARLPRDRGGAATGRHLRVHRRRALHRHDVCEANRREHRRPARVTARHGRARARDRRAA